MRFLRKIWIIGSIFFLSSCEYHVMYHSYHHLPRGEWNRNDTLSLIILLNDTIGGFYQLDFLVRNQTDYPYQQLSLSVNHNFPDTASWKSDTLWFNLADEKGNWLGKGISGLYESVAKLDSADVYSQTPYTFNIVPITNDPLLKGVNDIGIIARRLSDNLNPPPSPRINPEKDEQQNGEAPQG